MASYHGLTDRTPMCTGTYRTHPLGMPSSKTSSRLTRTPWCVVLAMAALMPATGCVAAAADDTTGVGDRRPAPAEQSLRWGTCPPPANAARSDRPSSGATGGVTALTRGLATEAEAEEPSANDPLRCADLEVPVDHAKPDGRTITLKLGRLPATGESKGSVLVAYGGPGGPGIELTRQNVELWSDLRSEMDIITWDTRGYGEQFGGFSDGLPCTWTRLPVPEVPTDEAAFDRLTVANGALGNMCRSQDPAFFDNMSSADHARDMEAIRKALGEPKLNFYGASYAGIYAQAYGRMFPDRVRTLVLDGTANHATTDIQREYVATARANEQAMQRFFDWCRDRDSCAVSHHPERQWQRLLERAERQPIPAESNGYHYDAIHLQAFGLSLARNDTTWPGLGEAIRQGLEGDASNLADEYGEPYPGVTTPVTECLDWPRPDSANEMRATAAAMREASRSIGIAGSLPLNLMQCAGWPTPVTNPPEPLSSDLPPLLAAGARGEDEASMRAIENVPGSELISYDGPGHTLYPNNACAREHINNYLTDREVPPTRVWCE